MSGGQAYVYLFLCQVFASFKKAIINAGMTLFSCCLSYHIIKTLKRSACMCVCENFCCHTDKQFDRKLDLGKKG